MRDPKFTFDVEVEDEGRCDYCDVVFFRSVVIAFTVFTTIAGAVVVGLALILVSGDYRPELTEEFNQELYRVATAMLVIGAVVIIMSIFGCLATVFENSWFTVVFVMTLVLVMGAQLSCAVLTIFIRNELQKWVTEQEDCDDCVAACKRATTLPYIVSIILLVTLGLQLVVIGTAFKASRMRISEKEERLIEAASPFSSPWKRNIDRILYQGMSEEGCSPPEARPLVHKSKMSQGVEIAAGGSKGTYTITHPTSPMS